MIEQSNLTRANSVLPRLCIIAAMSENRVIGNHNHLPWHLPDEWENFKRITAGKPFMMGRTSFEAPDALHSDYRNVVLTSRAGNPEPQRTEFAKDIPAALALLSDETDVFILGGAAVFEQMLPLVQKLYLTIVHAELEGDAYFPILNQNDWELVESEYHGTDDDHAYSFSMNVYVRKMAD
ncbi:dihydrofolate reductase [Dyadobacter aurulentus]|uniref:dihydrofolate reductase n=1 Tax=Dyadobacter sp. UC 10 TaxID=2605428 RepID=UPI0011F2509E|nr:dihydrofolate reductase [Dyadobacter sp. UC 10]KAA0990963.1 dihydrofolate reductase [Dyadobacter sp. UC 10]